MVLADLLVVHCSDYTRIHLMSNFIPDFPIDLMTDLPTDLLTDLPTDLPMHILHHSRDDITDWLTLRSHHESDKVQVMIDFLTCRSHNVPDNTYNEHTQRTKPTRQSSMCLTFGVFN